MGLLMPFKLKDKIIISSRLFAYFKIPIFFLEKIPLIRNLSTYVYFICQK